MGFCFLSHTAARELGCVAHLFPSVTLPRNFLFDMYGDRKSQLTFLLYLNDDFEGGHTSFFEAAGGAAGEKICAVKVPQGGALCFFHGTMHDA